MFRRLLPSILLTLGLALAAWNMYKAQACRSMRREVGLADYSGLKRVDYSLSIGHDPREDANGFEIGVFGIDNEAPFVPPSVWTVEGSAVEVCDMAAQCGVEVNLQEILALSLGGVDGFAWYFKGSAAQRDFYLAYCYRAWETDLIFIYRGHYRD